MSAVSKDMNHRTLMLLFGGLFLTTMLGVALDFLPLVFLPLGMLFVLLLVYNLEWPFLLLFFLLPISWEHEFSNGFGTDLPTEPLMVFLLGAALLYYIQNMGRINAKVILHPITLLLILHYSWLWISTFFSANAFVSVKFSLAKTWYMATFFFLAIILLRKPGYFRKLLKAVIVPLFVIICIILWRHYQEGFSFEAANFVMAPFFRNHVNSAAMMSIMLPFVVYLLLTTKPFMHRAFYVMSIVLLIAGIFFSYTRAAHVSVLLSVAILPIFHFRLTKWVIALSLIGASVFITSLTEKNNYLEYAPEFEQTISHRNFEDLVSATYEGKDISTMERVYRWVAAFHMYEDKPLMGFGPGNFYNFYKPYTVTSFRTYVSDNPERSGVHCYYLMVLVEQGLIGLLIFGLLLVFVFLKLESMYHKASNYEERLLIVVMSVIMTIITLFQLINDLVETDKVGPFFFFILACLVVLDFKQKGWKIISTEPLARKI